MHELENAMLPEGPATQVAEQAARREFLKQVRKVAATAPAIALLLAASSSPAAAEGQYAPDQSARPI
jgi:hypothetical protein